MQLADFSFFSSLISSLTLFNDFLISKKKHTNENSYVVTKINALPYNYDVGK